MHPLLYRRRLKEHEKSLRDSLEFAGQSGYGFALFSKNARREDAFLPHTGNRMHCRPGFDRAADVLFVRRNVADGETRTGTGRRRRPAAVHIPSSCSLAL